MRRASALLRAALVLFGTMAAAWADDAVLVNVTLTIGDAAPVVAVAPPAPPVWVEGTAPVQVAAAATVSGGSGSFAGGRLRIDQASGGRDGDLLAVRHEGSGAGQIGVSGTAVSYGGSPLGTASGGAWPAALVIDLAAGDATAVQALLRAVVFGSSSDDPGPADRILTITAVDALAQNSAPQDRTVRVVPVNDPPTGGTIDVVTVSGLDAAGTVAFADPDGPAPTLAVASPPGAGQLTAFDTATGAFTYRPDAGAPALDQFTVTVNDGEFTATATVNIRIGDAGNGPYLWVVSDPPMEAMAGDQLDVWVAVDDSELPGGTAADLRFALVGAPAGMTATPDLPGRRVRLRWAVASGADDHVRFHVLAWDQATWAADAMAVTLYVHAQVGGAN